MNALAAMFNSKRKAIVAALCVILAVSLYMGCTHAWQVFSGRLNEFVGQSAHGALTISKAVENEDGSPLTDEQANAQFEFTVRISDGGEYSYTIDGVYSGELRDADKLYLSHGQTAVIEGLPVGAVYSVTETPTAGYAAKSQNHQGHIRAGAAASVEFTNTYLAEAEPVDVTLTVTKALEGEGANWNKEFEFTVIADGETFTFALKAGEIWTLPREIATGTAYEVYEADYWGDRYYLVGFVNGSGVAATEAIEVTATNLYKEPAPSPTPESPSAPPPIPPTTPTPTYPPSEPPTSPSPTPTSPPSPSPSPSPTPTYPPSPTPTYPTSPEPTPPQTPPPSVPTPTPTQAPPPPTPTPTQTPPPAARPDDGGDAGRDYPKTGDNSNSSVWYVIMAVCAILLRALTRKDRRG